MEKKYGIYPAIVCNVKDPKKRGRIKVTCADVFGDTSTSSAWCDPCVPCSSDDEGDICIPEVDEGVWVAFNDGDVNKPVYLGGWWSKESTPFGEDYPDDPSSTRIISFKNTKITIDEDTCTIAVGDTSIVLEDGKVTINGNLRVNGKIL